MEKIRNIAVFLLFAAFIIVLIGCGDEAGDDENDPVPVNTASAVRLHLRMMMQI